ncbi:F-box protein SKIP23-like [Spinacia oleracea]|uniref:F-box protein SKIP23-like n=1 Tax=Spinacia oleracea TaxID=3562 RepID=A0A9R0K6R2_SPIOL|nr:F-box protein SKIP23-like [Spinacia oleracea]
MDKSSESVRDWSSLPGEILSLILDCLNDTITDCLRLRGVCPSWRSSLSPIILPDLQFPFEEVLPLLAWIAGPLFDAWTMVSIKQSTFYLISSPNKENSTTSVWLTRVEETLRTNLPNIGKVQNPIWCDDDVKMLELKATVNLLDYRIFEVAMSIRHSHIIDGLMFENKMVMLPFRKSRATGTADNFFLFSLIIGNLTVFKFEAVGTFLFSRFVVGNYTDIIAYEGKFYATNLTGRLVSIDPMTLTLEMGQVVEVIGSQWEEACNECSYMVISCGRLYLVNKVRNTRKKGNRFELKVFVLGNLISSNGKLHYFWDPVTTLGDQVFFVSNFESFSLSAQEIGWGRGNCIFFTNNEYGSSESRRQRKKKRSESANSNMYKYFCGLYSLEDGRFFTINSLPAEYTNIFWPVPSWLSQN